MLNNLPTLELLEQTHPFPGPYIFKIIGKPEQGFVARVVALVREEMSAEADPPFRVRESVGGRHLSVTMEPIVQSAQQVLAIYRRLVKVEGLVMLL
jgi:putative lipoic acid-binding regulatory protein